MHPNLLVRNTEATTEKRISKKIMALSLNFKSLLHAMNNNYIFKDTSQTFTYQLQDLPSLLMGHLLPGQADHFLVHSQDYYK